MPSKNASALAKVQSLYVLQMELWDFLEGKEPDAKKAQKSLKEYTTLLNEVDPQYMGGEDVLQTLEWIPGEVKKKLKGKKKPAAKKTVKKKSAVKGKK